MSCQNKSVVLELIALKKPTALDELIDTVPKPKGAIPAFGLPRWKIMPLESKIPMIPGPEGSYEFTRKKLGKKLWVGSADAEFNLSDPHNNETEWTYEPLHDEHLARYFSQPTNIKRMIKLGFITANLDAKCSVKDYNMYRKYLKTLFNDSIKLVIKKKTSADLEERALYLSEKRAEKDAERLIAREKRMETNSRLIKNRLEEEAKLQRRREKQIKIEQRMKDFELNKLEAFKLRIQRAWEQTEILRQKQEAAAFIERQKIVKTIKMWRDSESRRKTAKAKRQIQEMEEKRKAVEERWQLRQELQKKQMQREQFILNCSHEERVMNIKAYNAKIDREQARMQKLGEQCKMFIKCYLRRHVAGQREGTCCIKRRQTRRLEENEVDNSCSAQPYHIDGDDKKEKKEKAKTRRQKRKKRNRKKRVVSAPEPEPKPVEVPTARPTVTCYTAPETPILKDNCKCEKIMADLLQGSQRSND